MIPGGSWFTDGWSSGMYLIYIDSSISGIPYRGGSFGNSVDICHGDNVKIDLTPKTT